MLHSTPEVDKIGQAPRYFSGSGTKKKKRFYPREVAPGGDLREDRREPLGEDFVEFVGNAVWAGALGGGELVARGGYLLLSERPIMLPQVGTLLTGLLSWSAELRPSSTHFPPLHPCWLPLRPHPTNASHMPLRNPWRRR